MGIANLAAYGLWRKSISVFNNFNKPSEGDTMILRCFASVNLSVSVSYADRSMTMYDSEDKREYVFGHVSEDLDRDVQVTAEVTILWEDRPNYVVEKTVINDGDSISIDVDEDAETNWK